MHVQYTHEYIYPGYIHMYVYIHMSIRLLAHGYALQLCLQHPALSPHPFSMGFTPRQLDSSAHQ